MERLRCIDIVGIGVIGILLCAGVTKTTGQNVINSSTNPATSDIEMHNEFIMNMYNDGCKCVKYDCGCCGRLEWDAISMDGKLCANASYLENDYGISITVTYNNFAIINETVSARNPPPICFGENIVEAMDAEICLRIYDIDIGDKFHACFEISGKIMKLTITKIRLGCIQTKLHNNIEYIEDNFLPLFVKKKEKDMLPSVIMV